MSYGKRLLTYPTWEQSQPLVSEEFQRLFQEWMARQERLIAVALLAGKSAAPPPPPVTAPRPRKISMLPKLGIITGMIGTMLAGIGVLLCYFVMRDLNPSGTIFKITILLIAWGLIMIGVGSGFYRLGLLQSLEPVKI